MSNVPVYMYMYIFLNRKYMYRVPVRNTYINRHLPQQVTPCKRLKGINTCTRMHIRCRYMYLLLHEGGGGGLVGGYFSNILMLKVEIFVNCVLCIYRVFMVYLSLILQQFELNGVVPFDCVRLVKYDDFHDYIERSFDVEDTESMEQVLEGVRATYMFDLLLEIRPLHRAFQAYKPGG